MLLFIFKFNKMFKHSQEEVDSGGIIAQRSVPVLRNDDVTTLQERVKVVERDLYPQTLQRVVSGQVVLRSDGKVVFK